MQELRVSNYTLEKLNTARGISLCMRYLVGCRDPDEMKLKEQQDWRRLHHLSLHMGLPLSPISVWPCDQTNVITRTHTQVHNYLFKFGLSAYLALSRIHNHSFTYQTQTPTQGSHCPPHIHLLTQSPHSMWRGVHVCTVTDLWPQSSLFREIDHLSL